MYIQARSSISIWKPLVDSPKAGDAIVSPGIATSNPFVQMRKPLSHALLSISPILYAMLDIRSNGDAIVITNFKNGVAPIGNAIAVAAGNA